MPKVLIWPEASLFVVQIALSPPQLYKKYKLIISWTNTVEPQLSAIEMIEIVGELAVLRMSLDYFKLNRGRIEDHTVHIPIMMLVWLHPIFDTNGTPYSSRTYEYEFS